MDLDYEKDDQTLRGRAFGMHKKCGATLKQLYRYLRSRVHKKHHKWLYIAKNWTIAPHSEWPNDIENLGKLVCDQIAAEQEIDRELATLLYFIKDVPDQTEQDAVAAKENFVQAGNYDSYVKNHEKYKLKLKDLDEDAEFHRDKWLLCDVVDLDALADGSNVIRRTMCAERNFRLAQHRLRWKNKRRRNQHLVDAFCWKWELYGFEKIDGKWVPLLMKVTVNVTPWGLMIFIPKWMSFDLQRDFIIRELSNLMRARGVAPQGSKRGEGKLAREELAREAYLANEAAKEMGIKGDERYEFIIQQTHLHPDTDDRRIRELICEGEALVKAEEDEITMAEILAKPAPAVDNDRLERFLAFYDELTPEEVKLFRQVRGG